MTASRGLVPGSERNALPEQAPPEQVLPDGGRSPGWRRWLVAAAWVLGVAVAFGCYLRLAGTRAVDSDGASQALQAWDMLHGNLLLHGWRLSDVSFYTTELPQYMLVELVRGLHSGVVHVAAAMTYTLVVLLAALLAKGRATGRAAAARVLLAAGIMLAPQLASGVKVLISSPDHIGTTVPVLVVWLVLDRARPRWYVPVVAAALLGWAAVADTLVLYIGVLPLALVCAIRVWRATVVGRRPLASQWYDLGLGAGALAAGVAGEVALHVIRAAGGFVVQPPITQFVKSVAVLPRSLEIAGQGLLLLGGADFLGLRPGFATAVIILHLAGVALAGWATLVAVRRFLRDGDLVNQVLVTAVVIDLAAYVLSTQSGSVLVTREIAAVLPFSAVLAGRLLADRPLAPAGGGQARARAACRRAGRLPGRAGVRDRPAAGAGAEPAAGVLADGPAPAHGPVRVLGVQRGHPDQQQPGPDPAGVTLRQAAGPLPLGVQHCVVRPAPPVGELRRPQPRHD